MFGFKAKKKQDPATPVEPGQGPVESTPVNVEVPEAPITLRGSASGVRAYNKKALYAALSVVGIATLSALMLPVLKSGDSASGSAGNGEPSRLGQNLQGALNNVPDFLSNMPSGSLLAPPEPFTEPARGVDPVPLLDDRPIALPLPGANPKVPDLSGTQSMPTGPAAPAQPTPHDIYKQQLEQRRYQMAVGALSASAAVDGFAGGPSANTPSPYTAPASVQGFGQPRQGGSASASQPELPGAMASAGPDFRGMGPMDSLDNATGAGSKSRWAQQASQQDSDHYIKSALIAPQSPYEVKAGSVIPGVMISGINSDLPGEIIGQVSENVYDSVTGNHLLIPMGTRMVGVYNSRVSFGQERVQVAWNRLIFPDGAVFDLKGLGGYDEQGYSGFKDQVNNHYMRTFGGAILFSVFSGAVKYATSSASPTDIATATGSAQQATVDAFGQTINQLGSEVMQRNLQVQPTLDIRRGYTFQILVTKDLVFPSSYGTYNN